MIPGAPAGFVPYSSPVDFFNNYANGLSAIGPPWSQLTAYDLNTGTIAWQVPLGDGPRNHPLLKDLKLGPLGDGTRASPMVTGTLLFVSQWSGGLGAVTALKVGDRITSVTISVQ